MQENKESKDELSRVMLNKLNMSEAKANNLRTYLQGIETSHMNPYMLVAALTVVKELKISKRDLTPDTFREEVDSLRNFILSQTNDDDFDYIVELYNYVELLAEKNEITISLEFEEI